MVATITKTFSQEKIQELLKEATVFDGYELPESYPIIILSQNRSGFGEKEESYDLVFEDGGSYWRIDNLCCIYEGWELFDKEYAARKVQISSKMTLKVWFLDSYTN